MNITQEGIALTGDYETDIRALRDAYARLTTELSVIFACMEIENTSDATEQEQDGGDITADSITADNAEFSEIVLRGEDMTATITPEGITWENAGGTTAEITPETQSGTTHYIHLHLNATKVYANNTRIDS